MQPNYPSAYQSILLLLRLVLIIAALLIPYCIVRFIINDSTTITRLDAFYFYTSKILAQILVFYWAYKRVQKEDLYSLSDELSPSLNSSLLWAILGGLALIFLMEPIEQFVPATSTVQIYFSNLSTNKFGSFLYVVLISPVLNELIFRSIILRGFLKNYKPGLAILGTALLFSIFHVSLLQAVISFILSLFIGFVYWQTRSLLLCIILHILNNAVAYIIIVYSGQIESISSLIPDTKIYLFLYLLAAAALSITLLQIYKKNQVEI
ncbi:CPBP family intramembrane glutamic endopeptidase [Mangrovibacterium diazotrophicum]|uniref:CAAX prenyl protease-like protein n=1 Tax=Mangrovibacterium diazotrophicum TaxID=1261403 RepID=A0A419VVW0_9BACT|nr:type II CAAX endopeptidase family protein [Mangrovibacterium diazotrophicum]RKD86122.1 CAAX prenyl protease-like protein [Mangrovibacterium diazotrophicum]